MVEFYQWVNIGLDQNAESNVLNNQYITELQVFIWKNPKEEQLFFLKPSLNYITMSGYYTAMADVTNIQKDEKDYCCEQFGQKINPPLFPHEG